MKRILIVLLLTSLLLSACIGGKKNDQSVQSQLKGNQGLLLTLQNQADLDHLYMYYDGPATDAAVNVPGNTIPPNTPTTGTGMQQIGELNLLLHNIGGSATVGGLFVSGYDPNLIEVRSRPGQRPINACSGDASCKNQRSCFKDIDIYGTGDYGVTYFCEPIDDRVGYGGSVWSDNNGQSANAAGSLYNINVGSILDAAAGVIGRDTSFADKSIFKTNTVDPTVAVVDGKLKWQIRFSNPHGFDVNRASHGYLLINLFYADFKDKACKNFCRAFPDRAPSDIMSGVSDAFPQGDIRYADYDIYIDRSKWNPLINELNQPLQITACYLYTTTVTPAVCVDPTPQNNVNDPCSTTPIVFKETQGAPIKVSRIESKAIPGQMQYTIYVEHVGSGSVWLPGAFDQCSPYTPQRPDPRLTNAVQLIDARISGDMTQMTCLPTTNSKRIIRLENGKGQITCTFPTRAGYSTPSAAYQTSLSLEFGYLYQNTVRKNVVIHRT